MNGMSPPPSAQTTRQQRLNEEAASWLVQLETDDSADCRARFRRWLEESADHVLVFLETSAVYRDLEALPECGIDIDALVREVAAGDGGNVITLPPPDRRRDALAKAKGITLRLLPRRRLAGWAAALGAVSLVGLLTWSVLREPHYETTVGEQRTVKLPDGSIVTLNTRSRVKIQFSRAQRRIQLLEGEALFTVAQERARPFKVLTDSAVVQAIGTQFNVYRREGETTVSVIEGAVQVSPESVDLARDGATSLANASVHMGRRLGSGEEVSVRSNGAIEKEEEPQVSRILAWRQRKLDFNHATLQEVVEEFNRYNHRQIRIADAAIKARILNGVFNADEPEALLKFLAKDADLKIQDEGASAVIVSR